MTSVEDPIGQALTGGRYALIGAGQLGELALAHWPADIARPEFILDMAKSGKLDGIEIVDLAAHAGQPGVTYLLSTLKMPTPAIHAIFRQIGQSDILTVYDFFDHHTPDIFTNGWRNRTPSAAVRESFRRLPDYYADALSRHICRAVTAWRYARELVEDYPLGPEECKYELERFDRANCHYDVVYDGGTYDLSLLAYLVKAGISWGQVVAFEPDTAIRAACAIKQKQWEKEIVRPVLLDPRALSDRAAPARFLATGGPSSRLIANQAMTHADMIEVDTCRLDDVHHELFGKDSNSPKRILIKLHIEGSELDALHGAHDLLSRHHVDMLIDLSHDEPSYLAIPEYLASFGRFDLMLRCHALFGEGLTLFARSRS